MKVLCAVFVIFAAAIAPAYVHAEMQACEGKVYEFSNDWIDMENDCTEKMKGQVAEELSASMQYLAMAAHFSNHKVNRPGFAEHFFKAASEEREHAIKLISYLLMRGKLTDNINNLISEYYPPKTTSWTNGLAALKDALSLEAQVTAKIRDVIKVCENDTTNGTPFNHYHLVDYLTGDFLEEQYHGQRELAGMISTLGKMMDKHGNLGEFLYDKKLME